MSLDSIHNKTAKLGLKRNPSLIIIAIITLNAFVTSANPTEMSNSDIANLKAAFIYNFTKYITWPNSDETKTFKIYVLGDSEIATSLQKVAQKKMINDKPIKIRNINNIQDSCSCQIVFVSESAITKISEIISKLGNQPILTIGDTPQLCEQGIMINFFMQSGQIKFEINTKRLGNSGLKVSSQLQKLARIVE